jgi:hypothetical protein
VADQLVSVFDNGSDGPIRTEGQSRALLLDVDEARRTAAVRHEYTSRERLLATAMGSVQTLPTGHVVVGWGTASRTSAFAPDGTLLLAASLPAGIYSYRGQWLDWRSTPHHRPVVEAHPAERGAGKLIYVSWNGATELTQWRVDAGSSPQQLQPIGIAQRAGFETVIPLNSGLRYVAVTALDTLGRPLGRSRTVRM